MNYASVALGDANFFVKYDKEAAELSIASGITKESDVGEYQIKLQLIDLYGTKSDQLTITLKVASAKKDESSAAKISVN